MHTGLRSPTASSICRLHQIKGKLKRLNSFIRM